MTALDRAETAIHQHSMATHRATANRMTCGAIIDAYRAEIVALRASYTDMARCLDLADKLIDSLRSALAKATDGLYDPALDPHPAGSLPNDIDFGDEMGKYADEMLSLGLLID